MYKYSKEEMMKKINIGFEFKIKGEKCKMLSFINLDTDLYRYYFQNGKVYQIVSNEKNQEPISKEHINQPFYWNKNSIYCFISRGGRRSETSFDFLYEHEMFDDDGSVFIKYPDAEVNNNNSNYVDVSKKETINSRVIKIESKEKTIAKRTSNNILDALKALNSNTSTNYNKKSNNSTSVFDSYFCNDKNAIKLSFPILSNQLTKLYFSNYESKCSICFGKNKDCWRKYYNDCSNQIYWNDYHDDYDQVNRLFFDELFKKRKYKSHFRNNNTISMVLIGCGNFYELEALIDVANRYDLYLDLIVLDEGIWSYNSLLKVKNWDRIKSLWFKKCNFNDELRNSIYDNVDIIYYSRCLIHYIPQIKEMIFPNLINIIRNNQLTVFSQVVNVQETEPVAFENQLRSFLLGNCRVIGGHVTHKSYDNYKIEDELVKNSIGVLPGYPLFYHMYVVEGRK